MRNTCKYEILWLPYFFSLPDYWLLISLDCSYGAVYPVSIYQTSAMNIDSVHFSWEFFLSLSFLSICGMLQGLFLVTRHKFRECCFHQGLPCLWISKKNHTKLKQETQNSDELETASFNYYHAPIATWLFLPFCVIYITHSCLFYIRFRINFPGFVSLLSLLLVT